MAGVKGPRKAPMMLFRMTDVFLETKCSECGESFGVYKGHASFFQKELFAKIKLHNPVCGGIRKLCGEQAR
jgi:hypothetical protein